VAARWQVPGEGFGMSIWQRLSTAGRDFSAKGQISSLLGFRPAGAEKSKQVAEPDNEMPFTVGVIVLSAKMAKADGIVAADEVKAFKEAFKVSAAEMREAAHVFNSAKRDAANFEDTAEQLAAVFNGDRKLLEDVLDGLFHIAKADEDVHRQEEEFLGEVARRFGFTAGEFNAIKARHVVAARRNPYEVLGVDPSVGEEELERHYRKLIAEDDAEKLIARGVPKEFVIIAVEKRAALSEAYDAILKERSG
jgi:DnaJ like chaperone protein